MNVSPTEKDPARIPPGYVESQADFARRLGCSKPNVTKHKKAGRLVMNVSGKKVMVRESLIKIRDEVDPIKTLDPASAPTARIGPELEEAEASPAAAEMSQQQRAVIAEKALKAKLLQVKLDEQQGRLLYKDDVLQSMSEIGRQVRQSIEKLHLLADEIFSLATVEGGSAQDVQDLLKVQTRKFLDEMADGLTLMAERFEPDDD